MDGRAEAPAAGTVLNALPNGRGCAFAIDRAVTAEVSLDDDGSVVGIVGEAPNLGPREGDPSLIVRCVERALEAYADRAGHNPQIGATVTTESEVPVAAGLKSSSAAANAAVLATCDALGVDPDPLEACRTGVEAARDVGVTVTGAFDDASASMLGGLTLTDNRSDELLAHDDPEWDVLAWVPPERTYSASVDAERCERVAPMADLALELIEAERYATAMTVNGFAVGAVLGAPMDVLVEGLPHTAGISPSGTGPAVLAIGDRSDLETLRPAFERREGSTWLTKTRQTGARTK
jgi:shikimate kinase